MTYSYRWVKKDTEEIASLNESVFYGSMIVTISNAIIIGPALGCIYAISSSDDINATWVISMLVSASGLISAVVAVISGISLALSCELHKVYKEEQTNAESLSFVDRFGMGCCRKGQAPERDNSSEEGSKTGVYSFLRRLNVIKNLNLVERFSKKNPEKDYILSEFRGGEYSGSSIEREPIMQNTPASGSGYNTIGMS